ncbi:hypothetical protein BC834DRAFT_665128 [Gloeopeniophorella convolvens]|nr:hypothetical protein BC834DRAFT_665128 [Gloeopeniophorella convolvens]
MRIARDPETPEFLFPGAWMGYEHDNTHTSDEWTPIPPPRSANFNTDAFPEDVQHTQLAWGHVARRLLVEVPERVEHVSEDVLALFNAPQPMPEVPHHPVIQPSQFVQHQFYEHVAQPVGVFQQTQFSQTMEPLVQQFPMHQPTTTTCEQPFAGFSSLWQSNPVVQPQDAPVDSPMDVPPPFYALPVQEEYNHPMISLQPAFPFPVSQEQCDSKMDEEISASPPVAEMSEAPCIGTVSLPSFPVYSSPLSTEQAHTLDSDMGPILQPAPQPTVQSNEIQKPHVPSESGDVLHDYAPQPNEPYYPPTEPSTPVLKTRLLSEADAFLDSLLVGMPQPVRGSDALNPPQLDATLDVPTRTSTAAVRTPSPVPAYVGDTATAKGTTHSVVTEPASTRNIPYAPEDAQSSSSQARAEPSRQPQQRSSGPVAGPSTQRNVPFTPANAKTTSTVPPVPQVVKIADLDLGDEDNSSDSESELVYEGKGKGKAPARAAQAQPRRGPNGLVMLEPPSPSRVRAPSPLHVPSEVPTPVEIADDVLLVDAAENADQKIDAEDGNGVDEGSDSSSSDSDSDSDSDSSSSDDDSSDSDSEDSDADMAEDEEDAAKEAKAKPIVRTIAKTSVVNQPNTTTPAPVSTNQTFAGNDDDDDDDDDGYVEYIPPAPGQGQFGDDSDTDLESDHEAEDRAHWEKLYTPRQRAR